MIRVFIIDSTEDMIYYKTLSERIEHLSVDIETSADRAISRLGLKTYDLIIISRGTGRADLYDVAEFIKHSRSNKKAVIILLEDKPTMAIKIQGILKGRRVFHYKSNQQQEFGGMLERMAV
ncbi:MAG: hypothetical protein KAS32_06460 [Candidatus Peribacteraceae bacterium]|nr:hypothetical protein [Candidatus Peribacteraceae bacterium]